MEDAKKRVRRDVAETPKRARKRAPEATGAGAKVRRGFVLSREASIRLDTHAVGAQRQACEIIEDLIMTHLRRYWLSERGGAGPEDPATAVALE